MSKWKRSFLLMTTETGKMSPAERSRMSVTERARICSDFTVDDDGRSRKLVCTLSESHPDYEYNARLIENAPELLEVLENLRFSVDYVHPFVLFERWVMKCFCGLKCRLKMYELEDAKKNADLVIQRVKTDFVTRMIEELHKPEKPWSQSDL